MSNKTSPTVFVPSVDDVNQLKVGDLALDCFAKWSRVIEISYRGTDIKGKGYVGFFTTTGPGSGVSGSYKVGEVVRTVAVTNMLTSNEISDVERHMNDKALRMLSVHEVPAAAYKSLVSSSRSGF